MPHLVKSEEHFYTLPHELQCRILCYEIIRENEEAELMLARSL